MTYPRITHREDKRISPWVVLVEKAVQFEPDGEVQVYHCLTQQPYVGMLAHTSDGLIPLVRQFRPAVEEHTWEFPAGTVDSGETPVEAAKRELLEEVGLEAIEVTYLGSHHPDTGRLMVESHSFYIRCGAANHQFHPSEERMQVRYVSHSELRRMIVEGEFRHQLHIALYGAAMAYGINLSS
jgi:ADP-ribose pyrophosphatase